MVNVNDDEEKKIANKTEWNIKVWYIGIHSNLFLVYIQYIVHTMYNVQ
jgi:hypothetical protein